MKDETRKGGERKKREGHGMVENGRRKKSKEDMGESESRTQQGNV